MRNAVLALGLAALFSAQGPQEANAGRVNWLEQQARPVNASVLQVGHRRIIRREAKAKGWGHPNHAQTRQHGYGNAAAASQFGAGNQAQIDQHGNGNMAVVQQQGGGGNAVAEIAQHGLAAYIARNRAADPNWIAGTETYGGSNAATINQYGSGNFAIIMQGR